jgi:hypothetical protein
MKHLFMSLLATLALAVGISTPAQAQTSSTALIVRQSNSGVITIQRITNPNVGGFPYTDFSTNDPTMGCEESFWCFIEENLVSLPGPVFPLNNQGLVMIIYTTGAHGEVISLVPDDPSYTGPYVAYTSSLSTVENAIRDRLYLGL